MATPHNSVSTTWKYTIRINDTVDPEEVMSLPKSLADQSRVQFSHWHLEKWSQDSQPFVRGVLRCVKPTSLKQVTAMLPDANFKPLRGVFTVGRVNSELKPLYRVGEVCTVGSLISTKRHFEEACESCGRVYKIPKSESPHSYQSPPESPVLTQSINAQIREFCKDNKISEPLP